MYECRYCGNVVPKLNNVGGCPSCGGPKPKQLQPEVQTVYVERYVYIPSSHNNPAYYTPPQPTFSQRAYSTLGYKIVAGFTAVATVCFVLWFLYFWFIYRTGAPKDTDPAYQNTIPTAVATVTHYKSNSPWQDTPWLTAAEANSLRSQEQVVNLAYLARGGAKYSNQSVAFDANSWQPTKPYGVTERQVDGTFVQIKIDDDKYFLNIYQPFVIKGQEDFIYLVDESGQIWKANLSDINLVDLETVQNSLPFILSPNPELSPSY